MGEDRRYGAGLRRWLSPPGARIEMFDENLVYSLVGGKDSACGPAELGFSF